MSILFLDISSCIYSIIDVSAALEQLADGYFDINWQAMAVTFWTDQPTNEYLIQTHWPFEYGTTYQLEIPVVSCGDELIRRICSQHETVFLPNIDLHISLQPEEDENETNTALNQKKNNQSTEDTAKPLPKISEHKADEVTEENGIKPNEEEQNKRENELHKEEFKEAISKQSNPLSSLKRGIPERILLGIASPNREVFWEFGHGGLPNRHLLIFGKSGIGKTYAIQAILCELGLQTQNSVIVDYTNGFEDDQLEPHTVQILKPVQHRVLLEPLPINPFRQQKTVIGGKDYPEKSSTTAQRVMSVFASVYGLGDQQKSMLYQAIKEGVETYAGQMTLNKLLDILTQYSENKGYQKDAAVSVLSKIQPFVDGRPFGEEHPESWQNFYDDPIHQTHIVQMVGCGKEFARLVTEFTLIDFYWYARGSGNQNQPKVLVLDEIQNLDHSQGGPVAGFLTEGRKFGISLILATQTLSNLHVEERDRLFQAAHKLFFKPAETEIKEYARILENAQGEKTDVWIERLAALNKGECYSLGPSLNPVTGHLEDKAFKIRITTLGDRIAKSNGTKKSEKDKTSAN